MVYQRLNDDCTIGRYMDLPKVLHLALEQQIHFAHQTDFNDPLDGEIDLRVLGEGGGHFDLPPDWLETAATTRGTTRISCWHEMATDTECDLLWRRYADRGVLVKTTVGKLRAALQTNYADEWRVERARYPKSLQDLPNPRDIVLYKQPAYESEREVRALINKQSAEFLPVDCDAFVERVVLSPALTLWERGCVKKTLRHVRPEWTRRIKPSHMNSMGFTQLLKLQPVWPREAGQ